MALDSVATVLARSWKTPRLGEQGQALLEGIACVSTARAKRKPTRSFRRSAVLGQPFDLDLLFSSRLYSKSRDIFLAGGGTFHPTMISAARALSSPSLLENRIEYSPIEEELIWTTEPRKLLELRAFCSSLFHEQNHRILWQHLPPAPTQPVLLRRYLNLAESLVITLDMALGDELGPLAATFFNIANVTYDPGTTLRQEGLNRRTYRNYLQACVHATYLNLEFCKREKIPGILFGLFPNMEPSLSERAANRSGNLNRKFITDTNLAWQKRYGREVAQKLSGSNPLELSGDPFDNRLQYVFAEQWFQAFGL